jgi:ubiquinol-cytochrome c reductase core subunit 2
MDVAHELNEEVIHVMKLAQKSLLASPLQMALNSAHGIAFHSGLGTPLYSTSSTLMTKYLDAQGIADFSDAAYAKSNIAVVANGASHSEFSKWVREFFSEIGSSSTKLSSARSKYHGGEERIAHDSANVMILAFPGSSSFTAGSSFKPEISVLAALLGGESSIKWSPGFSLLSKASSDYQHAHVSTQNAAYSDAGLFYVTITGNPQHIAKASKNVVDTLKKIAAGEVAEEDIKKATALAKFRALEAGQNIDTGLEATGNGLISGGKPYQIDEVGSAIEKVSQDKVKSVSYSICVLVNSKLTVPRPPKHYLTLELPFRPSGTCSSCHLPKT